MSDPVVQVTEFTTGLNPGSVPYALAVGGDGNMWFTDAGTPVAVGLISTSGQITEFSSILNPGSGPVNIALGADGNLWFTDGGLKGIARMTTSGQITEFSSGLNPGSLPTQIAAGGDGNLWFIDRGTTKAIGRITTSGQITEFSSGLNPGSLPVTIAAGADGNLWFGDVGTTKEIGRISTSGQITEFSSGLNPGSLPESIAPGADGNLWFVDEGSTAAIGRISTSGQITEFSSGLNPGSQLAYIAPGADGNLWFTDVGSTKAIGRISTSGQITEFSSGLNPGSIPLQIAPGADGNLWFTDEGRTKAIGRVDIGALGSLQAPPTISGSGQAGSADGCEGGQWATWAGFMPSGSLFSFDGFQWLRDGTAIVGARGQSYTPTPGDVGHQLACSLTVTYPVPFLVTTPATSAAITVKAGPVGGNGGGSVGGNGGGSVGGNGGLSVARLKSFATSGATLRVTITCDGSIGRACAGEATVVTKERLRGRTVVSVSVRGRGHRPRVKTVTLTVARRRFRVPAGHSATLVLTLNQIGKQLLGKFYRLPVRLSLASTNVPVRTIALAYPRVDASTLIHYTAAFNAGYTIMQAFSVTGLPARALIELRCHGAGCPFTDRTIHPRKRDVTLTSIFGDAHLLPGATVYVGISALNMIGEAEVIRVRAGAGPQQTDLCLVPDLRRPQRCR